MHRMHPPRDTLAEPARPAPRRAFWSAIGLAAATVAMPALSATASGLFNVTVELLTNPKVEVQCDRTDVEGSAGKDVSVVCTESRAVARSEPRTDPRFLLHFHRASGQQGTIEGLMPPGTVTSWRVVNLPNRDYVEIVVGW